MSSRIKLQGEIDRVLKKVTEGRELFDEIWDKVYSANTSSQKEKFEADLKKEIKKLQRYRDQIKTWLASSDIKDKTLLMKARKDIESDMERFKVCEKEAKTKAYSKEGLQAKEKVDPNFLAKQGVRDWVGNVLNELTTQIEGFEAAIESVSAKKKMSRSDNERVSQLTEAIEKHRWHESKLELVLRKMENDELEVDDINEIRDTIEYYVESSQDDDFMDDDEVYDALGLDEESVATLTPIASVTSLSKAKAAKEKPKEEEKKQSGKGHAKASDSPAIQGGKKANQKDASKAGKSNDKASASLSRQSSKASTKSVPEAKVPTPPPQIQPGSGLSMAEMIAAKLEAEKKQKQQQQPPPPQVAAPATPQGKSKGDARKNSSGSASAPSPVATPPAVPYAAKLQAGLTPDAPTGPGSPAATGKKGNKGKADSQQAQAPRQQGAAPGKAAGKAAEPSPPAAGAAAAAAETGAATAAQVEPERAMSPGPSLAELASESLFSQQSLASETDALAMLDASLVLRPVSRESEAGDAYRPRQPAATPDYYPQQPLKIFESPALFERLETDALFFTFYFQQGSYQQYLAARELKRQSWRYHKKYQTWFQRHEEPKGITDEYEQGTYVYFDFETGWCQRKKTEFTFEYRYLEDELV